MQRVLKKNNWWWQAKDEREQVVSLAMLAGSVQLYIILMLIYAHEIFFLSLSLGLHTVSFYANLQDGSWSTESIPETAHGDVWDWA
jgi:hypothetical protein